MRKLMLMLCLSAFAAVAADLYNFNLLPSDGSIASSPGSTVGWGYALQNQSNAFWLVTVDLNSDSFLNATPTLLFDFPNLAPGSTVAAVFDEASSTGLLALTWDASAPLGFVNAGSFDLSAQWWDGDPLVGGRFVSDAPGANAFYTATVMAAAIPEPGTLGLTVITLLGLLMTARHGHARRQRQGGC